MLRLFSIQQFHLFIPGQPFDGILPAQGSGLVRLLFLIYQFQRAPAPGVFGTPSRPVGLQPLFHIVRDPGIETSVAAPEHIYVPGHILTSFYRGIVA